MLANVVVKLNVLYCISKLSLAPLSFLTPKTSLKSLKKMVCMLYLNNMLRQFQDMTDIAFANTGVTPQRYSVSC